MHFKRMAPKRNRKLIVYGDQNQRKEPDEYISTEEKSEEEKDEAEEEDDNVSRESKKKRAKPIPSAPAVNSVSKRPAETESESMKSPKRNRKLIVYADQNQRKEPDEYISTEEKSEEEKDEAEEEDDNVSRESKKKRAKPIPSTPAVNSVSKRPAETESESMKSKKMKSANISGGEEKRGRVWSDRDEITMLNGLIEFQSQNGRVTKVKIGAFHDFIKVKLESDANATKLYDKVKRLKAKYFKKCQDGAFTSPHELNTRMLSEKVWGVKPNGNANASTVSDDSYSKLAEKYPNSKVPSKNKHDLKVAEKNHNPELADKEQDTGVAILLKPEGDKFWDKYPCLSLFLRQGDAENLSGITMQRMPLLGSSKAKELDELEEKLSEIQRREMKLDMKKIAVKKESVELDRNKLDVKNELVKLVLDSSSKS